MASTEGRVRQLIESNLEVDGKPIDSSMSLDSSLTGVGVSSMDLVSFARVIQEEFGIRFAPDQCTELQSLGQLVAFLDANAA